MAEAGTTTGRPRYHDDPPRLGPVPCWALARALHRQRRYRLAKLVKGFCFFAFRAVLPPEAEVGPGIRLEHYGLGVVIHPNTEIGADVRIYHQVTIGSSAAIGGPDRIVIGSGVLIGTGARIINRAGRSLRIGDRARIGANAVVVDDVPDDAVVLAPLGRVSAGEPPS